MTATRTHHVVVRLSALGDVVLTTALLNGLLRAQPEDPVTLVTSADNAAFASAHFDKRIRIEGVLRPLFGLVGWFLVGWHLYPRLDREGRLGLHDVHGVGKTRALLAAIRLRAFFDGRTVVRARTPKRTVLRWLSILRGRDLIGRRFVFREHLESAHRAGLIPFETLAETPSLRTNAGATMPPLYTLLAAPDASRWKKRWPPALWERLLTKLLTENPRLRVTLVGGARSLPRDIREELVARFPERLVDLTGRTELGELGDIARAHRVVLCSNSAWLHIAEAVGTPVVCLPGPIVPGFGFSPWRDNSQELGVPNLECRPCSRHGGGLCRQIGDDFHACMTKITPERVEMALRRAALI